MKKIRFDKDSVFMGLFYYVPKGAIWFQLLAAAVLYSLASVYFPTQNGDNIEHIHSSFLIALGEVPYRDFFQHHNPLLWYLFAPVARIFAYNATITEVVCFASLLVFLKSLVYVYRIGAEFLNNKLWGLIAAAAVATPEFKLYAVDFRPDNYMAFCLMGGIYYYFLYLRDRKGRDISLAAIWFFISFLFAQKAVFPLLFIGASMGYFLVVKEIEIKDFIKAGAFVLAGFVAFGYYLYNYDMFGLYFASNYTFNLKLAEGFAASRIAEFPLYMRIWMWLGWGGALWGLFSKNKYRVILALLFISEFLQRRFYFSPYSYYYWMLFYFAVLNGCTLLYGLWGRYKWAALAVTAFLYFFFVRAAFFYYGLAGNVSEHAYLPDYIARKISPCDYVFNGDGMMYNLFGKDPAYYWQLIGQLDVIGEEAGIREKPDINSLIRELKPKFVFGRSYFNKFSDENLHPKIVHYVDKELIRKYYNATQFGGVYQLKSEYDNRKCKKDIASGKWRFVD